MKNKTPKILLVLAGIILTVLLLLPGIVKRYAINHSKELVGRQIQLEKLKVNYFTGTIRIIDFKMLELNEFDNFISFDTLNVNLEPLQLFNDKIEIEDFYLKGLDVNVSMKDSIFSFDDLIAFHVDEKDSVNQDSAEDPFKYSLSNLELKDANFHFNDQNIAHITDINNISFLVPFIGWDQEDKSNADVKFNFERDGYIESILNINPVNGEYDTTLVISDLYLDSFYEYVAEYAEINSFSGLVNSKIHIVGNTNNVLSSTISGKVKINDFMMTDSNNTTFLSAKEMDADIKEIDYGNSSYIIDSLIINNSFTLFQFDSLTNNFVEIFNLENYSESTEIENQYVAIDTAADNSDEEKDLYYAINHLDLNEGVLDYTDNLTGNPFNYHLSDIEIKTDSILSDSKWVDIQSKMLLNDRGTLKAVLGINPSNPRYINLDFSIEKFLLSDINIYSKHYTGNTILEGDMYYYSNSIISDGDIASENKLLVKNVSLKSSKGGLYNLPLKFALFLLKDTNGDVRLEIPVRGDLDDPSFNVSKIVWNTFRNLIIKAVTSPARLLVGLVGGNQKDIQEISFNYLDTIPSDKHIKQLDKLLDLEQKKEGIKIEMTYYIDENLQKEAIAKNEAGKLYYKETQKDYLKDEKGFEIYLIDKTASDSLNFKQSYMQITSAYEIDSIAKNNSKILISNIEKYLHMVNDSTHIKIIYSDPKEPDNTGSVPILKVNFSLQDDDQNL